MSSESLRFADNKNSWTQELAASGVLTGEWIDFQNTPFLATLVSANSNQTGTLYMQYSDNASDVDSSLSYKVEANKREVHILKNSSRYYRTKYENDSSIADIKICTSFGAFDSLTSPFNLSLQLDADAIPVRPSIAQDEIRTNRRSGVRGFTKWGSRSNLTAANGEETIWSYNGNFTPITTASTFTITYTEASDGATANGAKTLYFDYLDANGLPATATHTLGSDGSDVTSFTGLGINRLAVVTSGSTQTNGADITITATTGGTVQAHIPAGKGVTQQAIFHNGANHDSIAKILWVNVNKVGGASPKVLIKGYAFNRTYQTRYEIFAMNIDTSVDNFASIVEPVGFALSPNDILYFVADTDTNSTVVNLRFSLNEYQRV